MIGKITTSENIGAVINYILDNSKDAELIASEGIRTKNRQSIINSFLMQKVLNPSIKKPIYHISLGFSIQDLEQLSNERMSEIAREYLQKMGIQNTVFILVRHFDKRHPHVHCCVSRIDNDGKLISDKNDRYRNERVCKELTASNGLYFALGKERVDINRLKEPTRTKYQIYYAIKEAIPHSRNWNELITRLKQQGIDIEFKCKGQTEVVEGVLFSANNHKFSGSKIDKAFSFSKIDKILILNSLDRTKPFEVKCGIMSTEITIQNKETEEESQSLSGLLTDILDTSPNMEDFSGANNELPKRKRRR